MMTRAGFYSAVLWKGQVIRVELQSGMIQLYEISENYYDICN